MIDLQSLLRTALRDPAATFHPGQEEAIKAVLEPPHRALVVQATGWGKSMVYFIATRVLRNQGRGPTLVISPLLSLMRDQLRAAEALGLRSEQYTSANADEWNAIVAKLKANDVDLLIVSPERLANEDFRTVISSSSLAKAGMIVIDEAHCISDWGHDFRPDYQRIGELIRNLPQTTAVLATTATANDRVVQDIEQQIERGARILRGPLARKSLRLQVIPGRNAGQRIAWLADHLNELPGSGIIYALTQRDTERVAAWLQSIGHVVEPYHAGLTADVKIELEGRLLNNDVKALVATVALGMGFDKPDLGFVVHYQSPGNLVAYYQQVGRAGRAIPDALAILFMGEEDTAIHEWFIENARPTEDNVKAVLDALSANSLSTVKLAERVNLKKGELDKVLKTLSVIAPSPIVKVGNSYQRTPVQYLYDPSKEQQLIDRRLQERERFVAFAKTTDCLMMTVAQELDDPDAKPCGRCANCTGNEIISGQVQNRTLSLAMEFLGRSEFLITPRLQWIRNAFPVYGYSGRIERGQRCEPGLCLANWGDPGIAEWVATDKQNGHFRLDIVEAAMEAIRRNRSIDIEWVCAVPSLRSQELVPDFAKRLAVALGVPYLDAIEKIRDSAQQKSRRNSFHQAHNLDGAFHVREVLPGAVLLVDDMVDSRWTFTVIGALLRQAGSGPVFPFALCFTGHGGDSND